MPPAKGTKKRPYWGTAKARKLGQNRVLRFLRSGMSLSAAIQEVGISDTTIYRWRQKYPEFDEKVVSLLAESQARKKALRKEWKSRKDKPEPLLPPPSVGETAQFHRLFEEQKETFLRIYETNGSRAEACVTVGITPTRFLEWCDPDHPLFDEYFLHSIQDIERKQLWEVEDQVLLKAKEDRQTAKFVLETRIKEKYGPPEKTPSVNVFWFTEEGNQRARKFVNAFVETRGEISGASDENRGLPCPALGDSGSERSGSSPRLPMDGKERSLLPPAIHPLD